MGEKSVIWEYVLVPVLTWAGYLQTSKVSKETCEAKHDTLCEKLTEMHTDIREIRTMMVDHLEDK